MSARLILEGAALACPPWGRYRMSGADWAALAPDDLALLALWADTVEVHALFAGPGYAPLLASVPVQDRRYPALSPRFPAASGMERMVQDLWGHAAEGAADLRPWMDHGNWRLSHPLAPRPGGPAAAAEPLLRPVPEAAMQLGIGPVTGGMEGPAHLRAWLDGRRVGGLEARLGYGHKGVLSLMRGKSPRAAARFGARLQAGASVAHGSALARAAEAALGVEPPPRAVLLRAVMAETERAATHLLHLAAACAARPALATRFAGLREKLLVASHAAWGHRMMMDCVIPGGIAAEPQPGGLDGLRAAAAAVAASLPGGEALAGLGEGIGSLPARCAIAPAGVVARAAGVAADARVAPGYPPYGAALPALRAEGDAAARLRLMLAEAGAALACLPGWLDALPGGPVNVPSPQGSGEGLGVAEGPSGDIWHWVRLEGGLIASNFAADPGWRLWPLQEAASQGADPADLALIGHSFAAPRSGVDL